MGPKLQVLQGGARGERDELRELYERHGAAVRARCSYLLGDRFEAEDAMHDVFARAWRSLAEFRREASPSTWLMRIATHHCLNLLRARKAQWREELEQLARIRPVGDDGRISIEGRDLVRALLGRFDEETQAAAIHYYVDEMTLEEVGALLGRSIPTVRKRLAEFAKVAREELGQLSRRDAAAASGEAGRGRER